MTEPPSITLDNLYEAVFEVFPDLREQYEKDANLYEDDEGRIPHAFLGTFLESRVLMPELASRELPSEPNDRLVTALGFPELLLTDGDEYVQDAAGTTVCEGVVLEGDAIYERAKPYLGPVTRQTCEDLLAGMRAVEERNRDERRWWRRGP